MLQNFTEMTFPETCLLSLSGGGTETILCFPSGLGQLATLTPAPLRHPVAKLSALPDPCPAPVVCPWDTRHLQTGAPGAEGRVGTRTEGRAQCRPHAPHWPSCLGSPRPEAGLTSSGTRSAHGPACAPCLWPRARCSGCSKFVSGTRGPCADPEARLSLVCSLLPPCEDLLWWVWERAQGDQGGEPTCGPRTFTRSGLTGERWPSGCLRGWPLCLGLCIPERAAG